MWNVGLHGSQTQIKVEGRNINKLTYADGITMMAESETKEPFDENETGEWKNLT